MCYLFLVFFSCCCLVLGGWGLDVQGGVNSNLTILACFGWGGCFLLLLCLDVGRFRVMCTAT